jgi:hypothetical protein
MCYGLQVDFAQFFDWSNADACFGRNITGVGTISTTTTTTYTNMSEPSFTKYLKQTPYEQQAAAAAGYLLSHLYGPGRLTAWYMANASITQNATATVSEGLHCRT